MFIQVPTIVGLSATLCQLQFSCFCFLVHTACCQLDLTCFSVNSNFYTQCFVQEFDDSFKTIMVGSAHSIFVPGALRQLCIFLYEAVFCFEIPSALWQNVFNSTSLHFIFHLNLCKHFHFHDCQESFTLDIFFWHFSATTRQGRLQIRLRQILCFQTVVHIRRGLRLLQRSWVFFSFAEFIPQNVSAISLAFRGLFFPFFLDFELGDKQQRDIKNAMSLHFFLFLWFAEAIHQKFFHQFHKVENFIILFPPAL